MKLCLFRILTHNFFSTVFKFHSCQNKLRQMQWLKEYKSINWHFYRSEVQLDLTRLQSRCQQDCATFWRLQRGICFQVNSNSCQNLILCGCRTEIPLPMLSAERLFHPCSWLPSSSKAGSARVRSSYLRSLPTLLQCIWPIFYPPPPPVSQVITQSPQEYANSDSSNHIWKVAFPM